MADEDDDDETTDFEVADTAGKALALVTQIRKSPQARTFFQQCCVEVNELKLELLKWIRTRWASLFGMLEHTFKLRKGVNRFIQLADDSDEVPNLQGKSYGAFKLSAEEWKKLELMHDVLQEPANAQQSFSATREPTVWRAIPVLEYLQQTWQNMAGSSKFDDFSSAINSGLDNIRKWYHKIDETDVYFVCLVLDPNYKVAYAKGKWEPHDFDEGMRSLRKVFDKYYHHNSSPAAAEPSIAAPASLARHGSYGHSWMCDAVKTRVANDTANRRPRQELDDYLAAPLEDVENIVACTIPFNIPPSHALQRITLAIRGSAVASERAFSSGGITGTARRNCLLPTTFEALQLLKSGHRQGHISATVQAEFAAAHEHYAMDEI
ncbi:ribonuclease H-like domain-containing protein [Suillus subalutaceus]|uniref:ribonuclease H-like domain-containing protein n=1 Tax=Suillus subalutaceus TaxID=48586 RepID=UPI001B85F254|nr:ribonuclease H-like domain-containing protein [Suillus subalutaceus]KAG1827950.1 ribonuclease H-like domain-containing protein [Suillus subalutaceus]